MERTIAKLEKSVHSIVNHNQICFRSS